jgi:SpoVK/Ycf46/Vps4 family AAA+-type ATPase
MTFPSRAAIAAYLQPMLRSFGPTTPAGAKLGAWLQQNQATLGLDLARLRCLPAPSAGQRITVAGNSDAASAEDWRRIAAALRHAVPDPSVPAAAPIDDTGAANLAYLAASLGLDAVETAVLRFVFELDRNKSLEWLCDSILETRAIDALGLIGCAIGQEPTAVWNALSDGALGRLKLVQMSCDNSGIVSYYLTRRVHTALMPPNRSPADVERQLIGLPLTPQLRSGDFDHVARERDFLLRLLSRAVEGGRSGVNILLHGNPGTGKTEFIKTLAAELGFDLFSVGECDAWGGEPDRGERLDALQLADILAARRQRPTLLMFDEMQDLLQRSADERGDGQRIAGSKIFMNRLLERNRVPVLWATNGFWDFDPAFIRRMSYVLEMKPLPRAARSRMLANAATARGIVIDAAEAERLVRRFRVAPALLGGAVEAAALAGCRSEDVAFVAEALARAVEDHRPAKAETAVAFRPELANASQDLAVIEQALTAHALTAPGAPRDVSLMLYGPPGTGKSAYLRHLAAAMGLEPLHRRASDLQSKWIGDTEKRLAAAFAEAREDNRFLIIDEAEPFLWGRSTESRSWEVSIVDELLQQMEEHSLPFGCTTNLPEAIDNAAIRRFTLKLKFDFLTAAQAEAAYRHFFERPAPRGLRNLLGLTPSDFAAVLKRCRLLGAMATDDAALLAMLEEEVAAKNLAPRRIGF